jgi:hypothetical protein
MPSPLVPCPRCKRHSHASERACPFCSAALSDDRVAVPAASRRLSRMAVMTFASTLTMGATSAIVGCSDDGGGTVVDSGTNVAAYGAPIDSAPPADTGMSEAATEAATDSATTTDSSADTDGGSMAGAYGLPPSDGG